MRRAVGLLFGGLLAMACGTSPTPLGPGGFGSGGGSGGAAGSSGGGGAGGSNGGGVGGSSGSGGGSSGAGAGGSGSTSSGGGGATPDAGSPPGSDSGAPAVPQTVADLVALANSLPQPVTIADFIAALPHPLALNATSSQFSAQPAVDADDPRIFIVMGQLVLSVVPTGPNVNTLEVGVLANGMMSPAQLSFPITSIVTESAPYSAVLAQGGGGTTCAKCHAKFGAQQQLSQVDGVPVYGMGQIMPFSQFNVPVTTIISLAGSCDPSANAERCDIFNALTTPSSPTQYTFP